MASSELVQLVVSADALELTCHKALLGYFSAFFDAAFYGDLQEAHTNKIYLPEESVDEVRAFVAWIYSGHIESQVNPEQLWVLGDKFQSPLFSNEVMHTMFRIYDDSIRYPGANLRAEAAEIVDKRTSMKSKLREFVVDYIISHGPLRPELMGDMDKGTDYELDWRNFIRGGGDFVLELACTTSFIHDTTEYFISPYYSENHDKYLVPVESRPIKDFIQGKKRTRLL